MINADVIEGRWKELRVKMKERWGKLTDADLDQIAGKRERLADMLQQKYGIAKVKSENEIEQFLRWADSKYI